MQNEKCRMKNKMRGSGGRSAAFHLSICILHSAFCIFPLSQAVGGPVPDEFRVKRQQVFEFAEKPSVSQDGDRTTVRFVSKGYCDATVAVEDGHGRIVRHLAAGVLGPNAPAPLQKDSLSQVLVWDGKDDQGKYVDDRAGCSVRVSLGLKPAFERPLLWGPSKRIGYDPPIMRAAEEGVYVYDGCGVDHIRLFDHQGNYVRTIYPFQAGKLEQVKGLNWVDFPQGRRLPFKNSPYQQTLLTGGDNAEGNGMSGQAATAMALGPDGRIALAHLRLNRLATDGTTGGRPLTGPVTHYIYRAHGTNADNKPWPVGPTSAAFSPDGRQLYLSGFIWRHVWSFDALHGVVRLPFETDGRMEVFAGTVKQDQHGGGDGEFNAATSVAVDKAGRVYVSDFLNDRIAVFSPQGRLLKKIATPRPAQVELHPKTGDIYAFSWQVQTRNLAKLYPKGQFKPTLSHFGPFDDPRLLATYPLPLSEYRGYQPWWNLPPLVHRAALDGWAEATMIWLAGGKQGGHDPDWTEFNIRLFRLADGKLELVRDFGQDAVGQTGRPKLPIWNIQHQRMYVNPVSGMVYMGEPDSGPANKAFNQLVAADPATGRISLVDLPFNAEDIAFDLDGLIYLRTTDVVVRYDPRTWREVPWDYGEELASVTCGERGRAAKVASGLLMPSQSTVCFHQGGMSVSPAGRLAVSCALRRRDRPRAYVDEPVYYAKPYAPPVFPGRLLSSTSACVHVWDRHGRRVYEDAIPGMPQVDGLGIDRDDNLYVMATPTRMLGADRYFNRGSETLMKFRPSRAKFISPSPDAAVPLGKDVRPDRSPETAGWWVDGAEWFYGGVGFAGFNEAGCACWHARFALDYFARSFAPEPDQFGVAVLDAAGNLITRIGRYGNADDGAPLAAERTSPSMRSIGGDEVALFHACYTATHTDRRLFIADIGNARIVSVTLGYHVTEKVFLTE